MDKTIFIFDSRNNIFLKFFANITKNKILKQMNRKIFNAWFNLIAENKGSLLKSLF